MLVVAGPVGGTGGCCIGGARGAIYQTFPTPFGLILAHLWGIVMVQRAGSGSAAMRPPLAVLVLTTKLPGRYTSNPPLLVIRGPIKLRHVFIKYILAKS